MDFKKWLVITEVLNELPDIGNVGVRWEPEPPNPEKPLDGYMAHFNVGGEPIYVGFKRKPHDKFDDYYVTWDVHYSGMSVWQVIKHIFSGMTPDEKFGRTGIGKKKGMPWVTQALSSVFSVVRDFTVSMRPSVLSYSTGDPELIKFYQLAARRFAAPLGYTLQQSMLVRKDVLKKPALRRAIATAHPYDKTLNSGQ
jgi:hypothetical protein